MASALPRRDVSLSWPACVSCRTTHGADVACPRPGRWLIAGTPVGDPYPLAVLGTRVKR